MSDKKPNTLYQNTFLIIHDDELMNINTDEMQSSIVKKDFVEWYDSWKSKPNDVFKHQLRVEEQSDNHKSDTF